MGSSNKGNSATRDEWPMEDEEVSTHQEAIPVRFLGGTRRVSAQWLDKALNMMTIRRKGKFGKK